MANMAMEITCVMASPCTRGTIHTPTQFVFDKRAPSRPPWILPQGFCTNVEPPDVTMNVLCGVFAEVKVTLRSARPSMKTSSAERIVDSSRTWFPTRNCSRSKLLRYPLRHKARAFYDKLDQIKVRSEPPVDWALRSKGATPLQPRPALLPV